MTFRSGAATVARRLERSFRPRRTATAASHFPFTMTKSMTAAGPPSRRCRLAPSDRHVSRYPLSETALPGRGLVEVNGIEPMTSCLQSRRSPD